MKMPQLTLSKDGEKRATIKVETRLTLDDLAIFWLCTNRQFCKFDDGSEYSEEVTRALLKKEGASGILSSIKLAMLSYGVEMPFYHVGDDSVPDEIRLIVLEELEKIFI